MKHNGIHIPQSIDMPAPLMNDPKTCDPISMSAPPRANANVIRVTVLSLRQEKTSIVF
jgi:hypothetical protein